MMFSKNLFNSNSNLFRILLFLVFLPIYSISQSAGSQKISLLNKKVELNVPTELTEMSDEMWNFKYAKATRPILAMGDKNAEINLLAQYTAQEWEATNIAAYMTFRIENLKKTRSDVKILEEGVKEVSGKQIGYVKFMSDAIDTKIFNYYFFTVVEGKILLFTFNCMEKLRADWEKSADQIVASIKLN